ncbi:MAG: EAL domain-containing protein [Candidatus Thiodiazotropha endolucinida]
MWLKCKLSSIIFGLILLPSTAPAGIDFTAEERTWIEKNPTIEVGVDPHFAPYEFIDDEGAYSGIGADYLALLSKKTGLSFEVVPNLSWDEAFALSSEKKLDLHPMLTNTAKRRQTLLFTDEYIKDPYVVITHQDSRIKDELALNGENIALVKSYSATELALKHLNEIAPVYVETELEALLLVVERKVSATIGHLGSLAHLIDQYNLTNLRIIVVKKFSSDGMGIAVRNDWPILRDILNKALADITDEESTSIHRRWIMIQYQSQTDYSLIGNALIVFIVISTLITFWIVTLRQKVNERTVQYEQELIQRKKTEERFLDIVNSTDGIVWEADANDFTFTYVSDRAVEITGYSVDEWMQPGFWVEHLHHKDKEEAIKYCVTCTEKGEPHDFEYRFVCKNGELVWLSDIVTVIIEQGKAKWLRGIMINITDRKQIEQALVYQASHDPLTGLVNRREFEYRAQRLIDENMPKYSEHALCYMDLDQFKVINDTCGHIAGDEMLRQLSTTLRAVLRRRDTLARLGGDEFAVLMEHCSLDQAIRVAESLSAAIHEYSFYWEDKKFNIGVSIGLVSISASTQSITDLLKNADAACYVAKDLGRNRIHVYDAKDESLDKQHGQMAWVSRIQHAIDHDLFCLYAQAIVPIDKTQSNHYEVLIRMKEENGKIIAPGSFLYAAERYNQISQLDRWVIKKTLQFIADNPLASKQIDLLSINISGQSLGDSKILNDIISLLHYYKLNPEKLCFEITETATVSNMTAAISFISTLKGLGIKFALDDFGTGLSSFAYLKKLPVDFLKIDGLFVKDIVHDELDFAMVKSINEIGQLMGMKTIAEFVENDGIRERLKGIRVNYVQGYGIERPIPINEIIT